MDHHRFDHLARILATVGSRRHIIGALAFIPSGGVLCQMLEPAETAAKDRRRRRKQRHKRRKQPGSRKPGDKRGDKKRSTPQTPCVPESVAQVCAGRCGNVQNNCQQQVDCGSCDCEPACEACFTCQRERNTPGVCVIDPARQGKPCGDPGQVCLDGGVCACDAESCDAPDTCGGSGVDGACGCTPTTCIAAGANCGTIADGCGGELACGTCSNHDTCGGSGQDNVCGCAPTTCSAAGAACGSIDSGCGSMLDCGSCPYASQQCNGNTCSACVPTTCAAAGADCGMIDDGCGGQINCDVSCTSHGFVCRNNVCSLPCPPGPFC